MNAAIFAAFHIFISEQYRKIVTICLKKESGN